MIFPPAVSGAGAGYEIPKSLRFRASASAFLSRTPGSAGNRKTWTWSGWVKRGTLSVSQRIFSAGTTNDFTEIGFVSTDTLLIRNEVAGTPTSWRATSAVYRDPSAHYHIIVAVDTTQATATNRVKLYVNGEEVTSFSASNDPALNYDTFVNNNVAHYIGRTPDTGGPYSIDGYLSEINFIDGQALTPSSFGQTDANGAWQPKKYTGTYGTNGFYLPFNDGTNLTNLCLDRSGNGNNWTATNVSLTAGATYDWMDDVPGNSYATLNPLKVLAGSAPTNGNLTQSGIGAAASTTIPVRSGKWYAEIKFSAIGTANKYFLLRSESSSRFIGYRTDAQKIIDDVVTAYGATWRTAETISIAFDIENSTVEFFRNGVSQGSLAYSMAGEDWVVSLGNSGANGTDTYDINFGQRPFAYTPPTGFKALCQRNLPDPAIAKPKAHFDVVAYTGTGASRSITGLQFAPDLVWMKSRGRAVDHALFDRVRGAQLMLESNQTGAETTESTGLTAFNSDGWTMGALDQINGTTATNSFIGWAWKANGAPVTNTAGTITSQVSANTTAGFSIVTYTGTGANATVGHGLGVAPKMVIVRNRNSGAAVDWHVWHTTLTGLEGLYLNTTAAKASTVAFWNSTVPTSSVFSVGTSAGTNENSKNHVAYCFAEVPGFSRIGSYTGNGSTDGPFVYCGFRPAFVLVKQSSAAGVSWIIQDSARGVFNVNDKVLLPNAANAETTVAGLDFVSNGFKVRTTDNGWNQNAQTYIFIAFAESSFQYSRAR